MISSRGHISTHSPTYVYTSVLGEYLHSLLVIRYLRPRKETPRRISRMYKNRGLLIVIGFLVSYVRCNEELWCYQCNVNLKEGTKGECNDPYALGATANLTACPQNEKHHCVKIIIYYKHVHTTVRGCVPSSSINTYCAMESFPQASVDCHFCKDNACNGSFGRFENSLWAFITWIFIGLLIVEF